MREKKFRAWDSTNKRMYYQDNVVRFHFSGKGGWTCYRKQKCVAGCGILKGSCMQYTGLKDKDGKEIYESDILGFSFGIPPTLAIMEVYWNDYDLSWGIKCKNAKPKTEKLSFFPKGNIYDIEIIGNIYENPELVEN